MDLLTARRLCLEWKDSLVRTRFRGLWRLDPRRVLLQLDSHRVVLLLDEHGCGLAPDPGEEPLSTPPTSLAYLAEALQGFSVRDLVAEPGRFRILGESLEGPVDLSVFSPPRPFLLLLTDGKARAGYRRPLDLPWESRLPLFHPEATEDPPHEELLETWLLDSPLEQRDASLARLCLCLTPVLAAEARRRAGMDEPVELHRALGELLQEMHESQVCWVYPAGPGPALVGIAHLHHDPREPRRFATVAGALADLDALELQPERLRAARARAARPLRTRLDRLDRAVEKLRTEAAEADGRGELEEHAHTLLAFGSRLPRGLSEVELPRMSDPSEKLRIPLDPLFNGVENATRKLRTASRLARRVEVLQRRRAQVDRDREDLAREEALVRGHADWRELESLGVLEEERSAENFKPVDHTPTPDEVMRTTTSEGWAVLIGRNARQNDFLTHQLARPGDLWFHAESVPGSHVVLRVGSRAGEPSAAAVEEAAAYAAFFSKSRNSSLVPVLVAEKRHVRRTRGGPGKVVVERGKTLMVAPRKPMNPNSGP